MGNRVARVKTEVSEAQMAQAIIEAWRQLFNDEPSKQQVALILAQNALETGHRKSMWNYNVGNITVGSSDYDFFGGDGGSNPLHFRSYSTLKDGVIDYLKLLSGKYYSKAWQHILHPDPVAFTKALKEKGYFTEADDVGGSYTKSVSSLYDQFSKSTGYDEAKSGKSAPTKTLTPSTAPSAPKETEDSFGRYLGKFKGDDVYSRINKEPANENYQKLDQVLDTYLKQVAASHKKIYQKNLPNNSIIIEVKANAITDAIEFSRILCSALDEELLSTSFTHTDGINVEVECNIAGPQEICVEATKEITSSVVDAFKKATVKVGSIQIKTNVIINKKSTYKEINLKTADTNYRKFLLKFF